MTDDFWDSWEPLKKMFDYCRDWFPYVKEGHWPDCDMLPLGRLRLCNHEGGDATNFTKDEQMLLMSLWSMFRSPLMFGGDMTMNDEFTLSLMQNKALININKNSHSGREVYRKGNEIIWAANGNDGEYYIAQFNVGDTEIISKFPLSFAGIEGAVRGTELWTNEDSVIDESNTLVSTVPAHGVRLNKIKL